MNKIIRIEEISLGIDESEILLKKMVANILIVELKLLAVAMSV